MVLSLLAVMALGATTTAMAPAQVTPKAPEQLGRQVDRIDLADLPDTSAPVETEPVPVTPGEHCRPTPAGSRERRAGAVEACVTMSTTPVTRADRQPLAAARQSAPAAAANEATCEITNPGQWNYSRFGYCVSGLTVLYVLKDSTGKQLGTGTLSVATSALLPAELAKPKWNEYVTVAMTGATGTVTSLTAKLRAACTTGCKVTKPAPWWGGDLVKGKSVNGYVTYSSSPGAGKATEFTTSYQLYVTSPGAQITDPNASWSNPRKIRCDDAVRDTTSSTGTPGPGCVVPSYMAVVDMSATSSSSAAAGAYLWAQRNLADGWGRDKPLTRAKSGIADRTSRTCGSGSSKPFQARTDVPGDSCGEFPFAATHEGGTDGAQCTEVIPNYSSGGWDVYVLDGGTGSPCVRAHVPLADNQSAEQQLSDGFANQRVLEAEQFMVNITASAPEPQGDCLKNWSTGALPSGNGWIKNTTEPVPHTNKTTNPLGPAGTRASTAQACIGKQLGTGSDAEGDITGWEDARLYRDQHFPTTGLARCHLIANILGGKGGRTDGGPDNLTPCWQVGMNTGTPSMRTYEFAAQKAVANSAFGPNDAILYQVTPDYQDATSTIPMGVTMTATIQRADGTSQPLFPDVYIPNTKGKTGKYNLGN
ncbi:NucA/NucB deoxyribonuclease domain-containing protein [Streptomyces sp. NPDC057381]|uniref:DNA/RNA non-specific endonuclease n=1 Tax=Streptomyces sp. NPDC057381 TaxID=3346111 RepID=UPI003633B18A